MSAKRRNLITSLAVFSFGISGALISISSAHAQVQAGVNLRRSLSQIEFDEGYVPPHKIKQDEQTAKAVSSQAIGSITPAVLQVTTPPTKTEPAIRSAQKESVKKVALVKVKGKAPEARAMLTATALTEQKLDNQIIVPRLRGPFTERGDAKRIKSALSWKPQKKNSCGIALNADELCQKSRALKETLYRFSGNHDFFDSQCDEACSGAEEISVPQGLNIPDSGEANFRFVSDGGACHYELNRKNDGSWQVMTPTKVSCVCLSKSCFSN